jgi:hypothetical protein
VREREGSMDGWKIEYAHCDKLESQDDGEDLENET